MDLKYAYYDGNQWHKKIIREQGEVSHYSHSIAVDSNNIPHICYYDFTNKDLKYAYLNGTKFKTEIVDSEGDGGWSPYITLDNNDRPHVIYGYSEPTNTSFDKKYLKYAYLDGDKWYNETVDYQGRSGENFKYSIVIDDKNRPHIYYLKSEIPSYAYLDGEQWHMEIYKEFLEFEKDLGYYVEFAIDSNFNPYLVFIDDNTLNIAQYDGKNWSIEEVDSREGGYMEPSFALDSRDNPHITYWNNWEDTLKYAFYDEKGWHIETVLTGDGSYSKLIIDNNNIPHISFEKGSSLNWDLYYGVRDYDTVKRQEDFHSWIFLLAIVLITGMVALFFYRFYRSKRDRK